MSTLNTTALPPGRYFARATVTQGGKPQGHIIRPFRVRAAATRRRRRTMRRRRRCRPSCSGRCCRRCLASIARNCSSQRCSMPCSARLRRRGLRRRPRSRRHAAASSGRRRSTRSRPAIRSVAAFLRGVDLFAQGQNDRAMQQLQIAMQGAPKFAPARLYLGAALAQSNRHREAASLLQSVHAGRRGPGAGRTHGRPELAARRRRVSWPSRRSRRPAGGRRSGDDAHAGARVRRRPIVRPTRCRSWRSIWRRIPSDQEALLAGDLCELRDARADAAARPRSLPTARGRRRGRRPTRPEGRRIRRSSTPG